jgi:hypothetical protein
MKGKIKSLIEKEREQNKPAHGFGEREFVPNKTVKINNDRSSVKQNNPLPKIAEMAQKLVNNENEQKQMLTDFTSRFISSLKDKTLDENKSPTEREEEKRLIFELGNLCKIINDEPQYSQDMGTLAYVNMIARLLLVQRDRINELEFELKKVKK